MLQVIINGLNLDFDNSPQLVHRVGEELTISLVELILHHVDVLNRQGHNIALFFALDCE